MATRLNQSVVETAKAYLAELRAHGVEFQSAWLFGSSAANEAAEDSDIDIALVMEDVKTKFFKEVELTRYRRKIDSRIEPHVLATNELSAPFAVEVMETGVRIG